MASAPRPRLRRPRMPNVAYIPYFGYSRYIKLDVHCDPSSLPCVFNLGVIVIFVFVKIVLIKCAIFLFVHPNCIVQACHISIWQIQ